MADFPNHVGEAADESFKSIIKPVEAARLEHYLVSKASMFAAPFDGPTLEETRFDDAREQATSFSDEEELGEEQIAFLADIKTRLLEQKIIDEELSQIETAQLQALRSFFATITPLPPYKDRDKIRGAIELLRSKMRNAKK